MVFTWRYCWGMVWVKVVLRGPPGETVCELTVSMLSTYSKMGARTKLKSTGTKRWGPEEDGERQTHQGGGSRHHEERWLCKSHPKLPQIPGTYTFTAAVLGVCAVSERGWSLKQSSFCRQKLFEASSESVHLWTANINASPRWISVTILNGKFGPATTNLERFNLFSWI